HVPAGAAAEQADVAVQQGNGGAGERIAEVVEVGAVADVLKFGRQAPVAVEAGQVRPRAEAAVAAGQVVVGQPGAVEGTAAVFGQVAELAAQHQAAPGQVTRGQGGVVVRRQVQVDRLLVVEAVAVVVADLRPEQAGAAAVVGGKADPRRPQHRHLADAQGGVARRAHAFLAVDFDVVGRELPLALAGRAGRVGGLVHAAALAQHGDAVGAAIARAVVELVLHVLQFDPVLVAVAAGAGGGEAHAPVLIAHRAFAAEAVAVVLPDQAVGAKPLVGAFEFALAAEHGDVVAADIQFGGADVGRRAFAGRRRTCVGGTEHRQGPGG